jgi:hypothetical protein
MLPYSDVDIMILSEDEISEENEKRISTFISSYGMLEISNQVLVFAPFKAVLNKPLPI